jgi:hypothetical protein
MTEITNRTGIAEELKFLKNWGLTFRQAFADNPSRTYLKRHEETCMAAFQMLTGKKPIEGVDVASGLVRFKEYLALLYIERAFTEEVQRGHLAQLESVQKILFEPIQTSLF